VSVSRDKPEHFFLERYRAAYSLEIAHFFDALTHGKPVRNDAAGWRQGARTCRRGDAFLAEGRTGLPWVSASKKCAISSEWRHGSARERNVPALSRLNAHGGMRKNFGRLVVAGLKLALCSEALRSAGRSRRRRGAWCLIWHKRPVFVRMVTAVESRSPASPISFCTRQLPVAYTLCASSPSIQRNTSKSWIHISLKMPPETLM